jgi:hypothetical protein
MQQRLVRSGEFFEGNLILRRIFESARTHIDVIDPYVGARLLALLSVKNDAVHIRIIHNSSRAKPADIQALKDFKRQCSNVEIRALQDDPHDRTKRPAIKRACCPIIFHAEGYKGKQLEQEEREATEVKDSHLLARHPVKLFSVSSVCSCSKDWSRPLCGPLF